MPTTPYNTPPYAWPKPEVKLDPAFKIRWVAALRSRVYLQGYGRLRRTRHGVTEYCCLGIACDLLNPDWAMVNPDDSELVFRWISPYSSDERPATSLSDTACSAIQLDNANQLFLMHMNDNEHWTLAQIADWIEENL
jgi:hypothetical protein